MDFYNRTTELATLKNLFTQSKKTARMVVLTGRRQVGKTLLALEFAKKHKYIYFFVSKKSEALLCDEYIAEIKKHFDIPVIGEIKTFKDIFALLLEISKKEHFSLIIDEFQEFFTINPAVYSDIQHLWDVYKQRSQLNVIFIGSVYSLMRKIFEDKKEPLFGRADQIIFLKPFNIKTMSFILNQYGYDDMKLLFDYYIFTGGMPKYIDLLTSNEAFSFEQIINFMLQDNSPFLNEGKNLLIEEFGKEYGIYFSILELIAHGKTARSDIESVINKNVGGYLDRLERDYAVIKKFKPFDLTPDSKRQKYHIIDNFIKFWFHFIYHYASAIEMGNFNYVKKIIKRDYPTYGGKLLEKFFYELLAQTGQYNRIGSYWEKGYQNEIDLVAVNDHDKLITFAEIKLNAKKINVRHLQEKAAKIAAKYPNYKVNHVALSLDNAKDFLVD